ncbi:MAG: homoserine kinase [Eubacteriales bacterium]
MGIHPKQSIQLAGVGAKIRSAAKIFIKDVIKIFKVKIPATTTNLGPGFDCLGMSIELYNYITVEESDKLEIILPDKDKGIIPTDKTNLIVQAMQKAFDFAEHNFIPAKLSQENNIPYARGLGSSAACIVGGILIANRLMNDKLSFEDMLNVAVSMDGHPDNVLPAFTGGLTAATMHNGIVDFVPLMPHEKFNFVFIIPDFHLKTSESRKVLPKEYSSYDAVHSIGKAVVLASSLVNGIEKNLKSACDDLIHQPYRKKLIPHFDDIKEKAYAFGADAFYLSGAGPSLACIVSRDLDVFTDKMQKYLVSLGKYEIITSPSSKKGAEII